MKIKPANKEQSKYNFVACSGVAFDLDREEMEDLYHSLREILIYGEEEVK